MLVAYRGRVCQILFNTIVEYWRSCRATSPRGPADSYERFPAAVKGLSTRGSPKKEELMNAARSEGAQGKEEKDEEADSRLSLAISCPSSPAPAAPFPCPHAPIQFTAVP